jgi:hypothetical protein
MSLRGLKYLIVSPTYPSSSLPQWRAHSPDILRARIEAIAQGIAEDVEAQDDEDDGEGWTQEHPGVAGQINLRLTDHRAPFRGGGLHTQS